MLALFAIAIAGTAPIVLGAVIAFRWNHSESSIRLIQGLLVLFGTTVSSVLFVVARHLLGSDFEFGDALATGVPAIASLAVTGRCVLFRMWHVLGKLNGRQSRSKEDT
jgi:hypothetical protein